MTIRGARAIVTGGSSGIGFAVVTLLARAGASVLAVARGGARLGAAVADIERAGIPAGRVVPFVADVTREAEMEAMALQAASVFGGVDVLVTCAGIGRAPGSTSRIAPSVAETTAIEWSAVVDTNLRGVFLSNRAVLPSMIAARHGAIVNLSSARGGRRGQAFAAPYCASKFGVVGMTLTLAQEVARYGIRVQVALPDVTHTPLLAQTTLPGRFGALMPPQRVAELVLTMLQLPDDVVLHEPLLAPHEPSPGAVGHRRRV